MSNLTESARSRWTEIKEETREGANTATRVGDAGLQLVAAEELTESKVEKLKYADKTGITVEAETNYLPPKPFPGHKVLLRIDDTGHYGKGCYQASFKLNQDGISYRIIHDNDAKLQLKQTTNNYQKHSISILDWKFTSGLIPLTTGFFTIKPNNGGKFDFNVTYFDANQRQIRQEILEHLDEDSKKRQIHYFTAPQEAKYLKINDISCNLVGINPCVKHIQVFDIYQNMGTYKHPEQLLQYNGVEWLPKTIDNDTEIRIRQKRRIYRYCNGEYFYVKRLNTFSIPPINLRTIATNNIKILKGYVSLEEENVFLGIFFHKKVSMRFGSSKRKNISYGRLPYFHDVPYAINGNSTDKSVGLMIKKQEKTNYNLKVLGRSIVKKRGLPSYTKDYWRHYYGFIAYYRTEKASCKHEIIGDKLPVVLKVRNYSGALNEAEFILERQ